MLRCGLPCTALVTRRTLVARRLALRRGSIQPPRLLLLPSRILVHDLLLPLLLLALLLLLARVLALLTLVLHLCRRLRPRKLGARSPESSELSRPQ